jgi:hypothetical protein
MSLRRDTRKVAKTVDTIVKVAEKMGPRVGVEPLSTEGSFEPDGPECTKGQKVWVREVCKAGVRAGILTEMPGLPDELTIGQAEVILRRLGSPVGELYRLGRDLGQRKEQDAWKATR